MFVKGDGLPNGIECTNKQRTEIVNLIKANGFFCLASTINEYMPLVFNGSIWVICTNEDITNKFNYEELKVMLTK